MRKIVQIILLIAGIIMAAIGWNLDKANGTDTTTLILIIGGAMLTVGMLGVIWRDIQDYIRDKLSK